MITKEALMERMEHAKQAVYKYGWQDEKLQLCAFVTVSDFFEAFRYIEQVPDAVRFVLLNVAISVDEAVKRLVKEEEEPKMRLINKETGDVIEVTEELGEKILGFGSLFERCDG